MTSVSKTTSSASFDASPASSTHAPEKPPIDTPTRPKNTIPGLASRGGESDGKRTPRADGGKIRLSDSLNRNGEASAHRQPNGAPYDRILYHEPGTGRSTEVTGVKTANGGFDVTNPETGETVRRLAIVDSRQEDGTAGKRVGVDLEHAKLRAGMQSGGPNGGYYGYPMQAAGGGSQTGPAPATFHTQQNAPAAQPWVVGGQPLAAHVPRLITPNLTQLDHNQLGIALNPGNRAITNHTATPGHNGVVTHQFQVHVNDQTQPLGVRATVRNGLLQDITLRPSNRRYQFEPPFVSRRRMTPLAARHRSLNENDVLPYRQLENQYPGLFGSGSIRRAPETQRYLFHNVVDVGMDEPRVIRQSQGTLIGTDGLGPCIAICARGTDASGQSVLGMYHYSGAIETPAQAMTRMHWMMQGHGAGNVRYSLIGGMITPQEHESGSLANEQEFLSLSNQYPIEGVRLHLSAGEHDANGMENSVGVVLSPQGAVYRSEALYPYSA